MFLSPTNHHRLRVTAKEFPVRPDLAITLSAPPPWFRADEVPS